MKVTTFLIIYGICAFIAFITINYWFYRDYIKNHFYHNLTVEDFFGRGEDTIVDVLVSMMLGLLFPLTICVLFCMFVIPKGLKKLFVLLDKIIIKEKKEND